MGDVDDAIRNARVILSPRQAARQAEEDALARRRWKRQNPGPNAHKWEEVPRVTIAERIGRRKRRCTKCGAEQEMCWRSKSWRYPSGGSDYFPPAGRCTIERRAQFAMLSDMLAKAAKDRESPCPAE